MHIIQRRWNEVDTPNEIKKIIRKLRLQEKEMLPWKKKRALRTAEKILKELIEKNGAGNEGQNELIRNILNFFNPEMNDSVIDYETFSETWLSILQPALDSKRSKQLRKRKIITLNDITLKDIKLEREQLQTIYENCQVATTLDEIVASCIIAIQKIK